jgi:hypothetical protein
MPPLKQPHGHFRGPTLWPTMWSGQPAAVFYPLGHPTPYAYHAGNKKSIILNDTKLPKKVFFYISDHLSIFSNIFRLLSLKIFWLKTPHVLCGNLCGKILFREFEGPFGIMLFWPAWYGHPHYERSTWLTVKTCFQFLQFIQNLLYKNSTYH